MIGHGIIRVDSEPNWTIENPRPVDWVPVVATPLHYLYAEETDGSPPSILTNPVLDNPHLIGWWDRVPGIQLQPTDLVAYEAIRPLGNDPETGEATRDLYLHYFMGYPDRLLGDDATAQPVAFAEEDPDPVMLRYPSTNFPYEIVLNYEDNNGSWGWRATVVAGDTAKRNINNRRFRAGGSGPSRPFNMSQGFWSAGWDEGWNQPETIELELLRGGTSEGWWVLTPETAPVSRLFWAGSQATAGVFGPYEVDTGNGEEPDVSFSIDIRTKMVHVFVNGDPEADLVFAFNKVNQNVKNKALRKAIKDAIKEH